MHLGSFLKLPAPMLLMLFDEDRESLKQYLVSAGEDTQKEFQYLLKVCSVCDYQMPGYEKVSERFSDLTKVVNGSISGASGTEDALLCLEIQMRVVEKVLKNAKRSKFKKVPSDFVGVVNSVLTNCEFEFGEMKSVVNKIYRRLEDTNSDTLAEWATKFKLDKVTPEKLIIDSRIVTLTEQQRAVLKFFSDRLDWIEECCQYCDGDSIQDVSVFGISFFDLVMRKPTSICYIVRNLFEDVCDKKNVSYLENLIVDCKHEMNTFKRCFEQYVTMHNAFEDSKLSKDSMDEVLSQTDDECLKFFKDAFANDYLEMTDLDVSDLKMLVDVFCKTRAFCKNDVERAIGCKIPDWDSFVKEACEVRIYGLNDCSFELFKVAIKNSIFASEVSIDKSIEDVESWEQSVNDITALLKTMGPIGGELTV